MFIRMKDRIIANDNHHTGGFRGEVIFGRGKHYVPYTDPFGKQSYRTEFDEVVYKDTNIIPIGGYQFAFDKLFNIGLDNDTTLRVGDLNDDAPQMKIGVPRTAYSSINYTAEIAGKDLTTINGGINISANNFIFGFMIGDGGAREDNVTAIAPNYKSRKLFNPIPLRMSNDTYPMAEGRYYGKSNVYSEGGNSKITSYYVKKFDDPTPHIVHAWADRNGSSISSPDIVDDTIFSSTSTYPIESYVEINISLDKFDGRGYFNTTGTTGRVNEFALVSGWYDPFSTDEEGNKYNDYNSIRLFSHFTRPSIPLTDGDSIEAIYRLYAR